MTITSTCPGCGASLNIDDNAGEVICQFCGTHFQINLDGVEPSFRVAGPPSEPPPPAATSPVEPPTGETPLTPAEDSYNPPVPGAAPVAPNELYNPPIPTAGPTYYGEPPQPFTPPPFSQPLSSFASRLSGARLWIVIAVAVGVIFCLSCLCMLVVAIRILQR